ncbi:arginine/serine-rich coiled-coil protein 2 [Trichogramma pretiosum]|uniref:arginine/serine-rich coiled-coil protein 2 n=1 Tax=Trichogramma pretiosum TaxID=7493 RepID=UPI0006C9A288|nr:arginine/serine-rich coiled-coil protein 2 [Trichogramma pretiosum]
MNTLLKNYGSDGEDSDESIDNKVSTTPPRTMLPTQKSNDAIYDTVPMDMSDEGSNNNHSSDDGARTPEILHGSNTRKTESSKDKRGTYSEDSNDNDQKLKEKSDNYKVDKNEKSSYSSDKKSSDKKHGHDYRESDSKRSKYDEKRSRDSDRKSRDDDRRKDRISRDDDRNDRDRYRSDDKKEREKRREKERDREYERERGRDRDRDRRYSKDDKSSDRRSDKYSSSGREKERRRSRSRSRSRERSSTHKPFNYREERHKNKLAQLEKLGIDIKIPDNVASAGAEPTFYNPLATATQGKYAEQIQKRKLLWANKKQEVVKPSATTTASTWVGTTFSQDEDGKQTAKFKRLMGIKEDMPVAGSVKPDLLKKQEEMFSNMEQQYEVARATTHTQRGVGLGYASGGFPFPR